MEQKICPAADRAAAQRALIAYAEAMLARGVRVQYDDTRLIPANAAKDYRWQRQTRPAESYTSQYPGYTNCAAFTHDVYYFALGFDIGYWATDQLIVADDRERVFYRRITGEETAAERAALRDAFLAELQIADIIVYRRSNVDNGHAMLYAGGDRVIHSSAPGGGSYDYAARMERREPDGSIGEFRTDSFFEEGFPRFLFSGTIDQVAIVRPLNVWTGTVPRQSMDRLNNLTGVTAEKLCSKTVGQTVLPGEELTYTFRMENRNETPVTLKVRDTLDGNVTFVSGCDNADGGALVWTVTVPAGETKEIAYTVRVKDGAPLGGRIAADRAAVGGVIHPCPAVYIGKHLSDTEKAAVGRAARAASGGKTGWALAAEIYADAVELDLPGVLPSPQAVLDALFVPSADVAGHFCFTDRSPYFAAAAPTMFGGRVVKKSALYGGVRTRGPLLDQLEAGDILICTDDVPDAPAAGDHAMYMVAGRDEALRLTGGAPTLLTGDGAQTALDTAISYKKFVILRPAALRE